ncbi:threonine synthase, partial [Geobacillus thermodenitrificans]
MSFSYASHLYCSKCERTYDVDHVHQLCECGSPLLVAYDLEAMR